MTMICGEATIRLLERYGINTVFGIPGVHTLDFCRGLNKGGVRHMQARNEQGAGFMADGYARVTGKPSFHKSKQRTRLVLVCGLRID